MLKGFRFGLLLQLAVGPVCLFIFQTAVSAGFLPSLLAVWGVVLADVLYISAAILGLGAVLDRYSGAKTIFRFFGAAVLVLFGFSNLLGAFHIFFLPSIQLGVQQDVKNVFWKALLLTLSNPLTILFWAGVFSAKITEERYTKRNACAFGFGAALSTLFFLTAIGAVGSIANIFFDDQMICFLNAAVGGALLFLGVRTAVRKKIR